ncbi:MAG TPA: bifunctional chorismate mutase/prephenate dehydrogenase [Candidatus Krumholzibacteria bacterium]|nr:bifunctional chorismate mutase/prephenate dehydrogenase [Candidatus Krumholzibacteria bacterium]
MTPLQHPAGDDARSLPVLRALIDAVDHEVLQLLSRRNGLVAEIAAYKRAHGVAIRDHRREREIIADRRERSTPLGLQPDVIEGMYRLLLWASRDRQASLRAQVPLDIETKTVAVIGGRGAMGACMARLFADLGHAVMIADLDTELTPEVAAREADVVVISVPIDATVDVIRRIGPLVRADALFMDVTSIKTAPMQAMLASTRASVVGTHPLFGPSVHSLQGQRVALTTGRGDEWTRWLTQMLEARGLTVVETTPEAHDRAMAVVQVLTHFSTEVAGATMAKLGVPLEATLPFTSPIYLMELLMTARHFAQSPDLYASIQMSNPETARVTEAFARTAEEMRANVAARDHDAFARVFDHVHDYFGEFTERALEQSSFLIDRLVERA